MYVFKFFFKKRILLFFEEAKLYPFLKKNTFLKALFYIKKLKKLTQVLVFQENGRLNFTQN